MQKDTEKNQDTLYQKHLEQSKLIMELGRKGIWYQFHGTVPKKTAPKYEPTAEDWRELREEIKKMSS